MIVIIAVRQIINVYRPLRYDQKLSHWFNNLIVEHVNNAWSGRDRHDVRAQLTNPRPFFSAYESWVKSVRFAHCLPQRTKRRTQFGRTSACYIYTSAVEDICSQTKTLRSGSRHFLWFSKKKLASERALRKATSKQRALSGVQIASPAAGSSSTTVVVVSNRRGHPHDGKQTSARRHRTRRPVFSLIFEIVFSFFSPLLHPGPLLPSRVC